MGQEEAGRLIVADTGSRLCLEEIRAWHLLQPFAPVRARVIVSNQEMGLMSNRDTGIRSQKRGAAW